VRRAGAELELVGYETTATIFESHLAPVVTVPSWHVSELLATPRAGEIALLTMLQIATLSAAVGVAEPMRLRNTFAS